MRTDNINEVLSFTVNNAIASIISFVPRFVSGLIILLIGLIVAAFLKQVVLHLARFLNIDRFLKQYGVPEGKKGEGINWENVIAELLRWFVIIAFLIPAADIWGLNKFTEVLNNLLTFLPNVFVAVLLLLVGFVIANLVHDLLRASVTGISKEAAQSVAITGKYAVMIFAFLVVLNQLGIASDLIRILFSGFVAMLAIAGGIAFGLGGKDVARDLLQALVKKF